MMKGVSRGWIFLLVGGCLTTWCGVVSAGEVFTDRPTVKRCEEVCGIGIWAGRGLEERYYVVGRATNLLPVADSSQGYLERVKEAIGELAGEFACQREASGGDFRHWFRTPQTPGGTDYPTEFPVWAATSLLEYVGAPANWFEVTPWCADAVQSNGWKYSTGMVSALRWTWRTSSRADGRIQKYSIGYSTNSYSEAQSAETADWNGKSYGSSGRHLIYAAAVVVNAKKGCANYGCKYYINGFRLYGHPVLDNIPTSICHQASWYMLFEQGEGYTSASYDHPYYNHDDVGGLQVNVPHMVYVEELAVSSDETEKGSYPFYDKKDVRPSAHGYLPNPGYISLVKYVACDMSFWLLKWDVPGGLEYK